MAGCLEREASAQTVAGDVDHGARLGLLEHAAQLVAHEIVGLAGQHNARILGPVLAVGRLGPAHHDHAVIIGRIPHANILAVKFLLPGVALGLLRALGLSVVAGLDEARVHLVLLGQAVAPEGPQGRLGQRVVPGPRVPGHLVEQMRDGVGEAPAHVRLLLMQRVRECSAWRC